MAVALTYPGVYLEEAPGGPPPISGVATSIAAFVGWTNRGPIGEPIMVESWIQYQQTFGGLIQGSYLGYAVYQFFQNGGTQAYIVRLFDNVTTPAAAAQGAVGVTSGPPTDGMTLYANNPGLWSNGLCVSIPTSVPGPGTSHIFSLQVLMLNPNGPPTLLESFSNLSTDPTSPQFAITIVNNNSSYITFTDPTAPSTVPFLSSAVATTPTSLWVVAGLPQAAPAFAANATLTQTGTSASANLLNAGVITTANATYLIFSGAITGGTANSTGAWGDGTHSFTPTSTPFLLTGTPPAPNAVSSTICAVPLILGDNPVAGVDGAILSPTTTTTEGDFEAMLRNASVGYQVLTQAPIFNLLCVPGETCATVVTSLQEFCNERRAFLIVDAAQTAVIGGGTTPDLSHYGNPVDGSGISLVSQYADHSAFYYPWITAPDPATGKPTGFPPCGFVAGIYASTDAGRGVWKAPAGVGTGLTGVLGLQSVVTDAQDGLVNPFGINCLRQFPSYGTVVWGARTIAGSDAAGSQWKYVPIRRLALFLESSLWVGTQWVVFEPNDEKLWGQVRLSIGAFMQGLFQQGAFAGSSPQKAYFVKCDADNNPPTSVALGVLNITVGFAPLYPAEFIVIQIQQMTQT
jgi:phage tail sheath protein FI